MLAEQQAEELPVADEGSWVYLIAAPDREGATPLRDCVVEALDAELAMAYGHRRPVVGVRLADEASHGSAVQAMLERYERSRLITCDDPEDCAADLHRLFSDPDFAAMILAAGGEHAADA